MREVFNYLHEFNMVSAVIRLVLAMICGAVVGYGRTKKARAAGIRTYMLVSIGAAMATLIALYEQEMINTSWSAVAGAAGAKMDVARIIAQIVVGIGFLGAGTIIKASHQEVKGLTTATGLFAAMCMGMAAGIGFYEIVIIALVIVELFLNAFSSIEGEFKRKLRNITLNVEFTSVEDISKISDVIVSKDAQIFDIDIERMEPDKDKMPNAIFIVKLGKKSHSHSAMLTSVAELPCVYSVQELIS